MFLISCGNPQNKTHKIKNGFYTRTFYIHSDTVCSEYNYKDDYFDGYLKTYFNGKLIKSQYIENKTFEIEVIRLDSTIDYYIIYAISNDKKFKIVTRKVDLDCKNVTVSGKYNTTLTSMSENVIFPTFNRCDVHYGWGGNNTILNETEWGCDIFLSDEIFGLCYTTDIEKINLYKEWIEQHPLTSPRASKYKIKHNKKNN
jgi:hypothetical protein